MTPAEHVCAECGGPMTGKSRRAKFCDTACRMRSHRRGGPPPAASVTVLPGRESPANKGDSPSTPTRALVADAVVAELEAVDQLDSALGRVALSLAVQIDDPYRRDTGSAVAALVRELRSTLEAAKIAGRPVVQSTAEQLVDEVARRRAEHAARGA